MRSGLIVAFVFIKTIEPVEGISDHTGRKLGAIPAKIKSIGSVSQVSCVSFFFVCNLFAFDVVDVVHITKHEFIVQTVVGNILVHDVEGLLGEFFIYV